MLCDPRDPIKTGTVFDAQVSFFISRRIGGVLGFSHFHSSLWGVTLVRLNKGKWLPLRVRKLALQGIEIGEKLLWKFEETQYATKPTSSVFFCCPFLHYYIRTMACRYLMFVMPLWKSQLIREQSPTNALTIYPRIFNIVITIYWVMYNYKQV